MQEEYIPKNIEIYVQKYWKKNKTFQVSEDTKKKKYYCLPMLPYPSGRLHMGHVRNYTISDVISRYQRMLGKNVLQPIGWDAFGLPAEEAAIKNNTIPSLWTDKNIKYMKKQLKLLGFSYDWSREITTCKPEYYRWEQWFFIQLFKKRLVYKKNSLVNWCPYDKTVLANEQVINGCCWRCQSKIKVKKIPQWFLKIRNYAESLYQDLKTLKNWPEKVKNMQKNWIGRTEGYEITLNIFNSTKKIKVFTTRLDAIMGATYVTIDCCHKLVIDASQNNITIKNFIKNKQNSVPEDSEQSKFYGINTNIFALHPITAKKIPIWVSNFIIKEYGTNAVISIPGHNKNDRDFAVQNNIKIKYVILNPEQKKLNSHFFYIGFKGKLFNSGKFNNLNFQESTRVIEQLLLEKNIIEKKIHYKLQDWCISRQRYWGAPIPMVTLNNGSIIPVSEKTLPVILPEIKNVDNLSNRVFKLDSKWSKVRINKDTAIRETDTFDTFMESSWYYARYTCTNFNTGMIDPKMSKYWLPVDQYIGGIEHAIMHLMYFRFYHKLLRDFQLVHFDEPVKNLLCQGMVLSDAFYTIGENSEKNWIHPSSIFIKRNLKGEIIQSHTHEGKKAIHAGMIKMSKSKNNGIEPDLMIEKYGADTIRLFIMFAAPVESSIEWKESGVKGIHRFLKKLWRFIFDNIYMKNINKKINIKNFNKKQQELYYTLHKTIAKVSDDINRRQSYNTAISSIMSLVNKLIKFSIQEEQDKSLIQESLICIIKMLYPFTPHFCFIIWSYLYKKKCIDKEKWPMFKQEVLLTQCHILVIQINGKKQCTIEISNILTQKEILEHSQNQIIIKKKLKHINIKKIIYIPKKIVNFVI